MRYLKFWKPYVGNSCKNSIRFKLTTRSDKTPIRKNKITSIKTKYNQFNSKICFFTLKYKIQVNFLKQSRHRLFAELNFNKCHSFFKKI